MARPAKGSAKGVLLFPFSPECPWQATPPLPNEVMASLESRATRIVIRKNLPVYSAGANAESLYIVREGIVATFHASPYGEPRIAAFRFPGDLVGLNGNGVYLNSAVALSSATLLQIETSVFTKSLQDIPNLGMQIAHKLLQDIAEHQHHAFILSRSDAVGRVAMFVEMLKRLERSRTPSTKILYLPMKRSHIAAYLGLTIEAISRAFGALERQGVLRFRGMKQFEIRDRQALDALIAGGRIGDQPPGSSRRAAKPRLVVL